MIVRGTTPTIRFQFKTVDPREMEAAYLTISQDGVLIEKGLGEAEAYGDCLEWRLSQAETLSLVADRAAGYISAASFDGSSVTGVQDNAPASLTQ